MPGAEGFEHSEMVEPCNALEAEGAQTEIVSPAEEVVADRGLVSSYGRERRAA